MRPFFILYPERTVVPGITSLENSSFFFRVMPPKKKAKKNPAAEKVPVPDDPPTMDSFDVRANHVVFMSALTATRAFVGQAMHRPACAWLGACVTTAVGALRALASVDSGKRERFTKLVEGLHANGWSSSRGAYACVAGDTMPTAAKNAKILKSASALAEAYLETAAPSGDLGGSPEGTTPAPNPNTPSTDLVLAPRPEAFDDEQLIGDDELDAFIQGGTNPPCATDVTAATLEADRALAGRADALRGGGSALPPRGRFAHMTATGNNGDGFNSTFGCGRYDFSEARVFQEDPRTGTVVAVRVGQKRTHEGLVIMYNKECSRLSRIGHPDAEVLRDYLTWLMSKIVRHASSPDLMSKLIALDMEWREGVGREGVVVFIRPDLDSAWSVILSEAALASVGRATQHHPGGHGGRGGGGPRGGNGRHRGARNQGRAPPPGVKPACRDFARGACSRGAACRFAHN